MSLRAFTPVEEEALLHLAAARGAAWRDVPAAGPGPSAHGRLAKLGLASVMVTGPHRRARLTVAGRYFADLVAASRRPTSQSN